MDIIENERMIGGDANHLSVSMGGSAPLPYGIVAKRLSRDRGLNRLL